MATHRLFFFMVVAVAVTPRVTAEINCYTCTGLGTDTECLEDPAHVTVGSPITKCDMDCCTISRIEFKEDKGKISSFGRGCQSDCPKDGFQQTSSDDYVYYNTYCSDPLCNTGPGDEEFKEGGEGDGLSIHGIKGKGGASAMSMSLTTVALLNLLLALHQNW